jgi:hypothetical protein
MSPVYSGGLVYEFTNETNNYGIVQVEGQSLTELVEFTGLKEAYANAKDPGDGGYREGIPTKPCPKPGPFWTPKDELLPETPAGAIDMMKNGAGPGPGLKSTSSSQTAGTPSTSSSVPAGGNAKKSGTSSLSPSSLLVALGLAILLRLI